MTRKTTHELALWLLLALALVVLFATTPAKAAAASNPRCIVKGAELGYGRVFSIPVYYRAVPPSVIRACARGL
jgi:hypothetical protein